MQTLREQYEGMSPDRLRDLLSNAVLEPDAKRLCEQVLREKLGTENLQPEANQNIPESPLSAKGRFSRLSFIAWSTLLNIGWQLSDYALEQLFQMIGRPETNATAPYAGVGLLSIYVILIAVFVYFFFVFAIRRCHDIGIGGINSGLLILPIANLFFLGYLMLKPGSGESDKFGPPRRTFAWEKVVGSIGAVLFVLVVLATAITLAMYLLNPDVHQAVD